MEAQQLIPQLPLEGFVRPRQVAHVLGISRGTLYNRIRDGALPPPQKDGRITLWPVDVIRKHIRERGGSVLPAAGQDNPPTPAS